MIDELIYKACAVYALVNGRAVEVQLALSKAEACVIVAANPREFTLVCVPEEGADVYPPPFDLYLEPWGSVVQCDTRMIQTLNPIPSDYTSSAGTMARWVLPEHPPPAN